ncbi:SDR family oxidoreductase [Mucilaginibacter sp. BT774]|uniref:SDR family NAD(P)-dependent oxidoreductase n=1 Tax=Mucilaginibacter sp. BT774 TaxID=3062276 RepID=UPI002675B90A|nr:SDR family oxidoreductase [Mucilaginibacter sp. BT774]MDO3626788.1 SDR family oxidoreductase [Mucilaginibacter sp. BT774]
MNKYALITGASSGIGRSFALQLAQEGYHVMLTARSGPNLKDLAEYIRSNYKVGTNILALDLSKVNAAARIKQWCEELDIAPSILINNAGFGLWGDFPELDLEEQVNMHRLNTEALIRLTHTMLPLLAKNEKSYILNVSSTAAYQAVPTLSIYAASKAFVLSFSRALCYELKQTGISVSCLCPGPTDTGFAKRAGLDALADLAEKFNMSPDDVAAAGLKGLFKGKAEIVPGALNKISATVVRHAPKKIIERLAAGLYNQ